MTQSLHADVIDLLTTAVIDHRKVVIELAKRHPAIFVKLVKETAAASGATEVASPAPSPTLVGSLIMPSTAQWMIDAHRQMSVGAKVEAIKTIRNATGLGLKEAKDVADNAQNLMRYRYPNLSYYDNAAILNSGHATLANAITKAV